MARKPRGEGGGKGNEPLAPKQGASLQRGRLSAITQTADAEVPTPQHLTSIFANTALVRSWISEIRSHVPVESARRIAQFGPAAASALEGFLRTTPTDLLSTRITAAIPAVLATLKSLPVAVDAALDPRLQLAIINRRTGKKGLALASTSGEEVGVIARVRSVKEWTGLEDVIPGATLGQSDDKSWIVTGRLPIDRIEHVKTSKTILSLKASQQLHPQLASSIVAMGVRPQAPVAGEPPRGGSGVIIGIVDFGCDYAHLNFRKPDGSTRILALWYQRGVALPSSPYGYGRVFDQAAINAALAQPDPYQALGYSALQEPSAQNGAHGTHVMDIAAGNGGKSGQPGVAPEADIIFVEADSSYLPKDGPTLVNSSFGDVVQLLEAVRFIFDQAGDRPCVVNISLGTNGGPHDGTSLLEQGLDSLVSEKPNRAIVVAAGNSQTEETHTSGTVTKGADYDIVMQQQRAGGGELEFWYPGARRLRVTLIGADGTDVASVEPGGAMPVGVGDKVSIFISSRIDDPNNHDNVIAIWIAEGLSEGDWTIRLASLDDEDVDFHGWIERNDPLLQASFARPVATHVLASISTGRKSIVVSSYDAHKDGYPLSSFSSAGPTRDGRQKPEVAAPGHGVLAACSGTNDGVIRKSGTSMAAPAVTGLIALIFAEALAKGADLAIDELRDRLAKTAVPQGQGGLGWDPRYGSGRAIWKTS